MNKLGKKSLNRLVGVHPHLVDVVKLAITISEVDFAVLEGVRTIERQLELVKDGKSQTLNSRHLTGHAVDLCAWVGGTISWEQKYYLEIAKAMKEAATQLKIKITWGGDWKTLKDGPHFELNREAYPA